MALVRERTVRVRVCVRAQYQRLDKKSRGSQRGRREGSTAMFFLFIAFLQSTEDT
jgi:hypothetical protein